jgi:hypothetical protein
MTDDEALEAIRAAYEKGTPERRAEMDAFFKSLKPFVDAWKAQKARAEAAETALASLKTEHQEALCELGDAEARAEAAEAEVKRLRAELDEAPAYEVVPPSFGMEGPWPRAPQRGRHPDGGRITYDIPWLKDWRTVTGRTLKEAMAAHDAAVSDGSRQYRQAVSEIQNRPE